MTKRIVAVLALLTAGLAFAANVVCPVHTYARCSDTGRMHPQNPNLHLYSCTCGDHVWAQR